MPSIVSGFEYDIFISYRHKDNKGEHWVSEFVNALKTELEATFKEDISIYFDENPHDGLLETHDVDDSLKGKLKCLIFIPIISQTYCDTKSFAWNHEFLAFKKIATEDLFGLKIKLANGNIASRILPVRIHELDPHDKALLESELGPLRPIDFIFKAIGVNRPLRAKEDHPNDNINKTYYRDQVNKTANAVKDIITAIRNPSLFIQETDRKQIIEIQPRNWKKQLFLIVPAILLLITTYLLYPKFVSTGVFQDDNVDKSVAVLPFLDMSPRKDQEWFSDGLTEDILNSLTNLNALKVTARTSSFYFKSKDVPLNEIAEKLGVAHIVEGSVQRIGDRLRITVQLIRAKDEFHIWSKKYDRTAEDLFKVQTEIAEDIAKELLQELTPEKKQQLITTKPTNIEAYQFFLKGVNAHFQGYLGGQREVYFEESEKNFLKAIALEPTYTDAFGALADLYDTRRFYSKDDFTKSRYAVRRDSVLKIGYRLNPDSPEVLMTFAEVAYGRKKSDSAGYFLRKAYHVAPNNALANWKLGKHYMFNGMPELGANLVLKAVELDPLSVVYLKDLFRYQAFLGDLDVAEQTAKRIYELNNNDGETHWVSMRISVLKNNRPDALQHARYLKQIDSVRWGPMIQPYLLILDGKKPTGDILNNPTILSLLKMKNEFLNVLKERMLAQDQGSPYFSPSIIFSQKLFDFVRDEPEFKIIVERVKKNKDELMAKYGNLDQP